MSLHARRIQVYLFQVRVIEHLDQLCPDPLGAPAIEASPHTVPISKSLGQVTPGNARLGDKDHGVDKSAVVFAAAAWIALLSRDAMANSPAIANALKLSRFASNRIHWPHAAHEPRLPVPPRPGASRTHADRIHAFESPNARASRAASCVRLASCPHEFEGDASFNAATFVAAECKAHQIRAIRRALTDARFPMPPSPLGSRRRDGQCRCRLSDWFPALKPAVSSGRNARPPRPHRIVSLTASFQIRIAVIRRLWLARDYPPMPGLACACPSSHRPSQDKARTSHC